MDVKKSALAGKQRRIVERALVELFSDRSFRPIKGIDDLRTTPFGNLLELTDNRTVILTEAGVEKVETIVDALHAADLFDGLAGYTDLWSASWKTLQELRSSNQVLSDADDWTALVRAKIAPKIQERTFVIPFIGVELDGIDEVPLGSLKLLRPSIEHLDKVGVDHSFAEVTSIISGYRGELWLTGTARGTKRVAAERFAHLADLAAAMLIVAAACMQPSGATNLFISPNMVGHQNHGRSVWFSWQGARENFSLQTSGLRGVPLPINSNVLEQLTSTSILAGAMPIFENQSRTPLQDAITKGFHWFVDAHRDPTPVMQFVKYWSCVEAFFSGDKKDITRSVSVGLASVLVFGGYQFAPVEDYPVLKKRIAKLYGLRSKAVHRASRTHITENDVAELSHRVAQLLANAISFSERGYKTPEEIKAQGERLESISQVGPQLRAEPSAG